MSGRQSSICSEKRVSLTLGDCSHLYHPGVLSLQNSALGVTAKTEDCVVQQGEWLKCIHQDSNLQQIVISLFSKADLILPQKPCSC